jgi:hypothetical protein
LKFEGTIDELSKKFDNCKIQITIDNAENWLPKLEEKYKNVVLEELNKISIELNNTSEIPAFVKDIINDGVLLYELKIIEGLEQWFMNLIEN